MKQYARLFLVSFMILTFDTSCFGQYFNHVSQLGGVHDDRITETVSGVDCSYFIAGIASADTALGITGAFTHPFIAKFDSSGSIEWVKQPNAYPSKMTTDHQGNLYIISCKYYSNQPGSIIIIKYNTAGIALWSKTFPVTHPGAAYISTDMLGNLYAVVSFTSSVVFGSTVLVNNGIPDSEGNMPGDMFIVSLSALNGNVNWAKKAGLPNKSEYANGIGTDRQGNLYLAGSIRDSAPNYQSSSSNSHFLLEKYSISGDLIWSRTMGGSAPTWPTYLTVDSLGNCFVSGATHLSDLYMQGLHYQPQVSNSGMFIAKFSNLGTGEWVVPGGNFVRGFCLDKDLNLIVASSIWNGSEPYMYPGFPASVLGSADVCVLKIGNSSGTLQWVRQTGGLGLEEVMSVCALNNGQIIVSGGFEGSTSFDGHTLENRNTQPYSHTKDIFVARLIEGTPTTVSGTVFLDDNGNGNWDLSENPVKNQIVRLNQNGSYGCTKQSGEYEIYTFPGTHVVQLPVLPRHHTLTTSLPSATIAAFGQSETVATIGIKPIPGIKDVEATLTSLGGVRPGFEVQFRLSYRNYGTATLSSNVRLVYDDLLQFINSTPLCTSNNGGILVWEFTDLAPGEERNILIRFMLPANVSLGTILFSEVFVSHHLGYENPEYRHYEFNHLVTGSFDPNEKHVEPSSFLSPQQIVQQKPLIYTIRFQNTGTDTAFTVKVKDILSRHLEPSTIRILSSSHPYSFNLKEDRVVEWMFENILLPDSGRNNAGSNGYIKFEIKPRQTVELGDTIANKALIYFDYNDPIITNTTLTPIRNPDQILIKDNPFLLYPNPNIGSFHIKANFQAETPVEIVCFNAVGKAVFYQSFLFSEGISRKDVILNNQPEGIYFIQLKTSNQLFSEKMIIQSH